MSKKHTCEWLSDGANRALLVQFQSILRAGEPQSLATLPQDFLDQWKSSSGGAGVFHYAAKHGMKPADTISFLVGRGVDPNQLSAKGVPVICHALDREREIAHAWCKELLKAGVRFDLMPCQGVSVLLSGVQSNRPEIVELAIEAGAPRNFPKDPAFKFKSSPELHKIMHSLPCNMKEGALAMERLLPATQEDIDRQWLLSMEIGFFAWAEHFEEAGANRFVRDERGNTGLHALASLVSGQGRRRLDERVEGYIQKLCAFGLSPHTPNLNQRTPVEVASFGDFEVNEKIGQQFERAAIIGQARHLDKNSAVVERSPPRPRL